MTSQAQAAGSDLSSLTRHGWVATFVVVVLLGGLIAWAASSSVSGAVIAPGMLIVQDNAKRVQHPEGGVISQLLVRNEDVVQSGQLLAVLDSTVIAASLEIIDGELRQALALEARLVAELQGLPLVEVSAADQSLFAPDELTRLVDLEQQVLTVRQGIRVGRIAQIEEQIVQLDRQREGLVIQKQAIADQIAILEAELVDFEQLFAKQLIAENRGAALNKDLLTARGEFGRLVAAIAENQGAVSERALQIEQVKDEHLNDALANLQEVRKLIATDAQRRIADRDRLSRLEIRAPLAGVVHESTVHTVGGVVGPGETLMLIVPNDAPLLVNVRVSPIDIDKVIAGRQVTLRLPGLNARTAPELFAEILSVAPDTTQDPATGQRYYAANIAIAPEQLARLPEDLTLVPGMPVDAYMTIEDRTVLSYLVDPFVQQLRHAFREE